MSGGGVDVARRIVGSRSLVVGQTRQWLRGEVKERSCLEEVIPRKYCVWVRRT